MIVKFNDQNDNAWRSKRQWICYNNTQSRRLKRQWISYNDIHNQDLLKYFLFFFFFFERRQSSKWVCYNKHLLLQSTSQWGFFNKHILLQSNYQSEPVIIDILKKKRTWAIIFYIKRIRENIDWRFERRITDLMQRRECRLWEKKNNVMIMQSASSWVLQFLIAFDRASTSSHWV